MGIMRKIVQIDESKCNGCGQCVTACAEGAIQLIDGKARLVSDSYCDGLGNCLGECPMDAIEIIEREAMPFDHEAVKANEERNKATAHACPGAAQRAFAHGGCPGSAARELRPAAAPVCEAGDAQQSELTHWPVQMNLVSPAAPVFKDADLLLAADCVPFALADFHSRFLRGRKVIIGCPKLDDAPFYLAKLTEILKNARPRSLTVVHMEVPCCSALTRMAQQALKTSGVAIPLKDVTVRLDGSTDD